MFLMVLLPSAKNNLKERRTPASMNAFREVKSHVTVRKDVFSSNNNMPRGSKGVMCAAKML